KNRDGLVWIIQSFRFQEISHDLTQNFCFGFALYCTVKIKVFLQNIREIVAGLRDILSLGVCSGLQNDFVLAVERNGKIRLVLSIPHRSFCAVSSSGLRPPTKLICSW